MTWHNSFSKKDSVAQWQVNTVVSGIVGTLVKEVKNHKGNITVFFRLKQFKGSFYKLLVITHDLWFHLGKNINCHIDRIIKHNQALAMTILTPRPN